MSEVVHVVMPPAEETPVYFENLHNLHIILPAEEGEPEGIYSVGGVEYEPPEKEEVDRSYSVPGETILVPVARITNIISITQKEITGKERGVWYVQSSNP